ncbi:Sucrase/ferredoxin-like-domain-containing protein [Fomes fomentarius]|nr:Sucrase/ferredoxin-like-domain-containing protein [Fomes fomentarius]
MSTFRKLKALALGHNLDMNQTSHQLQAASVPVSEAPCRGCADPCDEGHDEYPKFDVDHETEMLGSVKPYGRQIVISTGKSDWVREVTDAKGTLAAHISSVDSSGVSNGGAKEKEKDKDKAKKNKASDDKPANGAPPSAHVAGVFDADPTKYKKVTILNGSHRTVSDDHAKETVLVFPDYKVVTEIAASQPGAEELWNHALSPAVGLHAVPRDTTETSVKSWFLPYSCVILLCAHQPSDYMCDPSLPIERGVLIAPTIHIALTLALEREGWEVHHQVEDPSIRPALSSLTPEDTEAELRRRLQHVGVDAEHKRALILYSSHIGGHKYAGNVIINTPKGTSIWYGRVTPHEVDAIVQETIIGGKILPALLRGGMNLCAPGRRSLNDW